MTAKRPEETKLRREYEPPRVIHTEPLHARAFVCAKNTSADCASGPILS